MEQAVEEQKEPILPSGVEEALAPEGELPTEEDPDLPPLE